MKAIIAVLTIILAISLISCSENVPVSPNNLITTSIPDLNVSAPVKSCVNVTCGSDEQCIDGECFCNPGLKTCNDICIPKDNCCNNNDCKGDQECKNGACVKTIFCTYAEQFDDTQNNCVCMPGYKYCMDQKKCIRQEDCCSIVDCNPLGGIDRRCIDTQYYTELCFEGNVSKHCKPAIEGQRTPYSAGQNADIYVKKVWEDKTDLTIVMGKKEVNLTLIKGDDVKTMGIGVSAGESGLSGGNCKTS